jgi:DNA-binding response OmpR family regulator
MNNHPKKILIIEDEEALRQAMVDKFNREGFFVIEAKDGEEGLDLAIKNHPDIILLDIIMPKIDGLSMLKQLRSDAWGKDVPILILTNLNDAEYVSQAVESGVYDFLVKSDWQLSTLVEKVKEKLNQ